MAKSRLKRNLALSFLSSILIVSLSWAGVPQSKAGSFRRDGKKKVSTSARTSSTDGSTADSTVLSGTWEQVGLGGGGRFQSIDFAPLPNDRGYYTAYIGGDTCGLFKSEDNGSTWIPINTGLYDHRTSKVAVNPIDPSTLYVATSGGLFKSTNAGASWFPIKYGRSLSTSQRNNALATVALDPANPLNVFIGTGNFSSGSPLWDNATEIYLSRDGGSTWNRVYTTSGLVVYGIAVNPKKPSSVYAALAQKGSGRLIHSADYGAPGSWTVVDSLHGYFDLGFDHDNHLFAAGAANTSGAPYVIRIEDSDTAVSPVNITPPIIREKPRSTTRLVVTPLGVVYVGDRQASNPTVWRYQNGQWSALYQYEKSLSGWADFTEYGNPRATTHSLNTSPDGKPWHGGSMQIYRWDGVAWQQKYTQRISTSAYRTNGNSSTTIFARDMIFVDLNEYYWGPADIYIEGTRTAGSDYTQVKFPDPDGRMNDARVLVADSQDPHIWYVSTHLQDQKSAHAKLLKKAADGTWQVILTSCRLSSACPFPDPDIPDGGGIMDVIARGNAILVSTYNDGVYRSLDGGISWSKVADLGDHVVSKFSRSLIDPAMLMAAVSSGNKGVWLSEDDGGTWRQVRMTNQAHYAVAWGGAATWYASEAQNIVRTQDNGTTWETIYSWQPRSDIFLNRYPDSTDISVSIINSYNPAENPVAAAFSVMGYFDHSCMGGVASSLDGGAPGTWRQVPLNGVTYFGWGVEFNPYDPFELFYLTYGSGVYKTRLTRTGTPN